MKPITLFVATLLNTLLLQAQVKTRAEIKEISNKTLLYSSDFSNDLTDWVIEQQPGGTTKVENGKLVINDAKGCTVWFKKKLTGPIMIEYEATMVKAGGEHDRVSDLTSLLHPSG